MKKVLLLGLTSMAVIAGGITVYGGDTVSAQKKAFSKIVTTGSVTAGENDVKGMRVFKMDTMGFEWAVEKGLISQATSDAITAFVEEQMETMLAEMEKVNSMSEAERKAYFESAKEIKKDLFEQLVTAGIITQAEADSLKEECPQVQVRNIGFRGMNFDSLVNDGVISQSTADKIEAFMSKKAESMRAEMEIKIAELKESGGSDGFAGIMIQKGVPSDLEEKELKAEKNFVYKQSGEDSGKHFSIKTIGNVDLFDELVTEGIITQAEADAIKAAMPKAPEMKDGFIRPGMPAAPATPADPQ